MADALLAEAEVEKTPSTEPDINENAFQSEAYDPHNTKITKALKIGGHFLKLICPSHYMTLTLR